LESGIRAHERASDDRGKNQDLDSKRLHKALKDEEKQRKNYANEKDDRKRGYNSMKGSNTEVTPEELEAYRLKKQKYDDPMKPM